MPAFITVALLLVYVREPERAHADGPARKPLTIADAKRLPLRYWLVVLLGAVFTLARFSEAFLVLRAQDVGLELSYVPLVMIVMNVLYAGAAYPAGAAADRVNSRTLLFLGLVLLIAADVVLALARSPLDRVRRGRAVGLAHGLHARLAVETRCGHRSCRSARHGFRNIQSCEWRLRCCSRASSRALCGALSGRRPRFWPVQSSRRSRPSACWPPYGGPSHDRRNDRKKQEL